MSFNDEKSILVHHKTVDRKEIDTLKGIYIILIVIGHNILLSKQFPEFRNQLYNFHVAGFLILPFLFRTHEFNVDFIRDRAVRYMVPYIVFYFFSAILFTLFINSPTSSVVWTKDLFVGLLLGTESAIKNGCGLALFWFLPTLFLLVVIRSILYTYSNTSRVLILIFFIAHFFVGDFGEEIKFYSPMGILIVMYILPIGIITREIYYRYYLHRPNHFGVLALLVSILCVYVSIDIGTWVNIGKVKLYDVESLTYMLLHDIYIIAAFFSIALISKYMKIFNFIGLIGKHSLVIYLSHSIIFHGLLRLSNSFGFDTNNVVFGLLSFSITLVIAFGISLTINRITFIRDSIFPRNYRQWLFSA